jgi:hypothetical protein
VEIGYQRDGESRTVKVTLGRPPSA